MKIFLDTASLDEIREAHTLGIIDGVTTNPSLMAKAGIKNVDQHYIAIAELLNGKDEDTVSSAVAALLQAEKPLSDVSAEVIATDYEGMVREGRHFAALHSAVVVKVPFTPAGVRAIRTLTQDDIRTNCTLIFSPLQALLAAKAGATYVSPFLGRLDDIAHDGMELIRAIRTIFDNYNFNTQILAASLRHTKHVLDCALAGADVCTIPKSVLMGLFNHPLTENGLAKFLADYNNLQAQG